MLISIITAVYNREKYILNAIESVLKQQSTDDIEYIIVDDGSTDSTGKLVDEVAKNDSRVKVIHQDNQWIYASFNNGIKIASGDYIYILNSDDKLNEESVSKLIKAIKDYNYPDVVFTKVISCSCDTNQKIFEKKDLAPNVKERYYCNNISKEPELVFQLLRLNVLGTQANLYKRELAARFPFRNDVSGADHLFNLELLKHISSFVLLPDEIYLFHIFSENEMQESIGKYHEYEHDMFNEYFTKEKELLEHWNVLNENNLAYLKTQRKNRFSVELRHLLFWDNKRTVDEKFSYIFNAVLDDVLEECFIDENCEERDSRILSEIMKYLLKKDISIDSEYYFVFELLESLLRYEKDEIDYSRIENAVYEEKNPYRIGEVFLKKISRFNSLN